MKHINFSMLHMRKYRTSPTKQNKLIVEIFFFSNTYRTYNIPYFPSLQWRYNLFPLAYPTGRPTGSLYMLEYLDTTCMLTHGL